MTGKLLARVTRTLHEAVAAEVIVCWQFDPTEGKLFTLPEDWNQCGSTAPLLQILTV